MSHTPPITAPDLTCRVIGLGGIGQVVATFLVRFLAGLRRPSRVVLIDGDRFEAGNETRMSGRLHENKAEGLQAELAETCPSPHVTILAVPEFVAADNVGRLLGSGPGESVLLCVDNHATRKLVGDHGLTLDDLCVISAGNDGVGPDSSGAVRHGTAGNVQVLLRVAGTTVTPALSDYHPEIAKPPDDHPDAVGCAELAASVPQILFTNVFAAACQLATWHQWASGVLTWSELVFDIEKGRAAPLLPLAPTSQQMLTSGQAALTSGQAAGSIRRRSSSR